MKKYLPLIFTLYMSLLGGNFLLYNLILPIRVAHQVLLTALLVYWFWKFGLPNTPMLLPVGAMAAAVGVSVVNSVDPRMALENGWHWFTDLGLFLLMMDWIRRDKTHHLFSGQFLSGGLLAASCILQYFTAPNIARVSGLFFGTWNLAGGYTAAQVVPLASWIPGVKGRWRKLVPILLLAGLVAAVILNQSRGAFLSLGVAALVFYLPRVIRRKKVALLLIPAILGMGAGVLIIGQQKAHSSGDQLRLDLWRAAGEMIQTYPTGVGPGVFPQAYREMSTLITRPDVDGVTGAHNLYLNLGAELGIPGIMAGMAFVAFASYLLTKVHWNPQKMGVLAALAGILAHMLVDNFPAANWTFLVSLYGAFLLSESRIRWKPRKAAKALGVGFLLLGVMMFQFDRAQVDYERSLNGDTVAARSAWQLDPDLELYRLNLIKLEGRWELVQRNDSTFPFRMNLANYAVAAFGRYWG